MMDKLIPVLNKVRTLGLMRDFDGSYLFSVVLIDEKSTIRFFKSQDVDDAINKVVEFAESLEVWYEVQ